MSSSSKVVLGPIPHPTPKLHVLAPVGGLRREIGLGAWGGVLVRNEPLATMTLVFCTATCQGHQHNPNELGHNKRTRKHCTSRYGDETVDES